jgi:repressor LexA
LPLAGLIAAGSPLLALQQEERIDFSGLFSSDDHVCLRVKGESMIEDHIQEGDYVVVKKNIEARDGDIVVARVDGDDATLKRYYRETHRVRLEPANKGMKPIFSNHVDVEGVVVGVIRQY